MRTVPGRAIGVSRQESDVVCFVWNVELRIEAVEQCAIEAISVAGRNGSPHLSEYSCDPTRPILRARNSAKLVRRQHVMQAFVVLLGETLTVSVHSVRGFSQCADFTSKNSKI